MATRHSIKATSNIPLNGIVLVDFGHPGAAHARRLWPGVREVIRVHARRPVFGKVNTETSRTWPRPSASRPFRPLMAFRDGILVFEQAGALPGHALQTAHRRNQGARHGRGSRQGRRQGQHRDRQQWRDAAGDSMRLALRGRRDDSLYSGLGRGSAVFSRIWLLPAGWLQLGRMCDHLEPVILHLYGAFLGYLIGAGGRM